MAGLNKRAARWRVKQNPLRCRGLNKKQHRNEKPWHVIAGLNKRPARCRVKENPLRCRGREKPLAVQGANSNVVF